MREDIPKTKLTDKKYSFNYFFVRSIRDFLRGKIGDSPPKFFFFFFFLPNFLSFYFCVVSEGPNSCI